MKKAIAASQQALQVCTRDASSEQWAAIQNNLALVYSELTQGNREENLEAAITACEQALQVYTIARCGHLKAAVLILEQSRARGLSESLDRDHANLTKLQQIAPHLYEQYRDIANQLRDLESQQRDLVFSSDRHSLAPEGDRNSNSNVYLRQNRDAAIAQTRLDAVIAQIRQVEEGYAYFLDQPNFEGICAALQPDCPLIYLVSTPAGSLALIITPDKIANLWLDNLPRTDFQNWFNTYIPSQTDHQASLNAIDSVTQQLWHTLIAPIIHYLKTHNFQQATLIPTGLLSFLPLHAAWIEDPNTPTKRRYALDEVHFTYAPNAKSLTAAQAIAQTAQATNILAIDNPTQDLLNSTREIVAAIDSFPVSDRNLLARTEATIAAVKAALPKAAILHCSCHGTANLIDPLNSGLLMSDGLLTLRDIFALNLTEGDRGIRLAILCACETGMIGLENVDEAISLPTGLLQAVSQVSSPPSGLSPTSAPCSYSASSTNCGAQKTKNRRKPFAKPKSGCEIALMAKKKISFLISLRLIEAIAVLHTHTTGELSAIPESSSYTF